MNYPEENEPSMNSDPLDSRPSYAKQPTYEPGDRFVAMLAEMTRESYRHLAEADLRRRLASVEWRVAKLEYLFNQSEQIKIAAGTNKANVS